MYVRPVDVVPVLLIQESRFNLEYEEEAIERCRKEEGRRLEYGLREYFEARSCNSFMMPPRMDTTIFSTVKP